MSDTQQQQEVAKLRAQLFDGVVSVSTFAAALNVTVRAVQMMIRAGKVSTVKIAGRTYDRKRQESCLNINRARPTTRPATDERALPPKHHLRQAGV